MYFWSCWTNPLLGLIYGHRDCTFGFMRCTCEYAWIRVSFILFIKYAIRIVALRLIPALQWTRTFVCYLLSSINVKHSSKYTLMLTFWLSFIGMCRYFDIIEDLFLILQCLATLSILFIDFSKLSDKYFQASWDT